MKRIIPLLSVILAACAAPEPPVVIKMDNPLPPMPAALKMACRPIDELPDHVTMGVLFEHYAELVDRYTTCRIANQAKIDWAGAHGL
ncbi:hypothetical protein EU642_22140 [Salmonella enterica]|nr:hypothetical protein [Salmonella enterica]EAR6391553.1 hypothetical protein [Salmonella enterica]EAV1285317.1 hypothetical protein [Salmonella enterica]